MNYIITDKFNRVTGFIGIGGEPIPPEDGHVYPVYGGSIPIHIQQDIGSYTYDGISFVKLSDKEIKQQHADEYKEAKLASMSSICNFLITNGIDIGEDHYSLKMEDQVNIARLGLQADDPNNNSRLIYHPDGKVIRVYSKEEMSFLYHKATEWINYNTTYYNLLKQMIMSTQDVDDILPLKYHSQLPSEYQDQLTEYTDIEPYDFNIFEITDNADYNNIVMKIDITKWVKPNEVVMEESDKQDKK